MRPLDRRRLPCVRRDLTGQGGQIFLFVLTTIFALFLVVATAINIGQAVTRKILLQMVADAGAFTGASEMARGLNTIADLNLRIQQAWSLMTNATLGFGFPPCPASDLGTTGYGVARANLGALIRLVNNGYGARAGSEARRVTEYNAVDLFPFERLGMAEEDSTSGLSRQRPQGALIDLREVPDGTAPEVSSMSPGVKTRTWSCWAGFPPVSPRTGRFDLWYEANRDGMPISFLWVVKAPRRRARVFDSFFGPFAIPEMTAAALARPVGGEIRRGRFRYVAKMVPLRRISSGVFDPVLRLFRPVYH